MDIIERNLQEIGKSLLITLPKGWTKAMGLKKGSRVRMAVSERGQLIIAPGFTHRQGTKEAALDADDNFPREFFKAYLDGCERIAITLAPSGRKRVSQFLQQFMNVQVIEENQGSIVVKVFHIEELSIMECLRRMHFLSLSMLDAAAEGDKESLEEMEQTLTRFYYLLVMQVRRFIDEGKYADQNQMSLLSAMDHRMIAERIERIGDIAKRLDLGQGNRGHLHAVRELYAHAAGAFINGNYAKAKDCLREERALRQRLERGIADTKSVRQYAQLQQIASILTYAREIAYFVR